MKKLLCFVLGALTGITVLLAESSEDSESPEPPGSLAADLNHEIDSRIAAAGPFFPPLLQMFSKADDLARVYLRNPAVWTGTIDLTGIGVHTPSGGGGTFGGSKQTGTLITPTDIATANHFRFNPGDVLLFADRRGVTYTAHIVSLVDVAGDLAVEHLSWSGRTPTTLKVMPVLPSNYESYSPADDLNDFPVLCANQNRQIFVQDAYLPTPFFENNFYHNPATEANRVPFTGSIVVGDSGQPTLAVVHGEAVLLACDYTVNAGPCVSDNLPGINRALTAMKSAYQVTLVNLSGFPTYK